MAKNNNELAMKVQAKGNVAVANNIGALLTKMIPQIQAALPKRMSPERMARLALTEIRTNPRLLECDAESLLACVMHAAKDGLEFGTGQCYMVPYRNHKTGRSSAQYQRGYQGWLQLVRNSGDIVSISAEVVRESDKFEVVKGYEEKLEHIPNYEKFGEPRLFYAYALLKDGGRASVVMGKAQVDAIRKRSKASSDGPWVTDYEEMAKKTVLKRLCKYLPIALEAKNALEEEDELEFGRKAEAIEINVGEIPPEPEPKVIEESKPTQAEVKRKEELKAQVEEFDVNDPRLDQELDY